MNPNDYPREVINPPQEQDEQLQYPSSAIVSPSAQADHQPAYRQQPYQAPQPAQPTQPAQPNVTPVPPNLPKKKSKWPLVAGFVVLLLIIIGAVVAVAIATTAEEPAESKQTQSVQKEAQPAHAQIVTKLQETIDAPDILHSNPPLGYKVRGYDYFTVVGSDAAYNISVQRSDIEAARNADAIESMLRENNFSDEPIEGESTKASYVNYFSDQVFCSRTVDTSPHFASSAVGETIVSVSCIDNSTIAETAKHQQPFYESFVAADRERAGFDKFVFGAPSEKASSTAGYTIASVPYAEATPAMRIVSSQLLFFKEPGDENWKFFTASDGILACEAYQKNQTIKKAFLGEQCIDQKAEAISTVKL